MWRPGGEAHLGGAVLAVVPLLAAQLLRLQQLAHRRVQPHAARAAGGGHVELEVAERVVRMRDAAAAGAPHPVALLALEEPLQQRRVRRALELALEPVAQHLPELVHVLLAAHGAPAQRRRERGGRGGGGRGGELVEERMQRGAQRLRRGVGALERLAQLGQHVQRLRGGWSDVEGR